MKCPHCGGNYNPPELEADMQRNAISVKGVSVKAMPRVVETLSVLLQAYPDFVSTNRFIAKIWGMNEEPDTAYSTLKVFIYLLRKSLKNSDWDVMNSYGRGWALVKK